ncbi:MAG TPA: hypothetical protein ENI85_14985 [Deltaproteobacteria bacterium]|nr:hypothetical protein [Deltaproteobacteria bacterium]
MTKPIDHRLSTKPSRIPARRASSPGALGRGLRLFFPLLVVAAVGCASGGAGLPEGSGADHDIYYTRFTIPLDRNRVRSTNYRIPDSAMMIPINTPVRFVSKRRYRFKLERVDGGQTFLFEHVKKHTLDTPEEAFSTFFSPEPIDLSGFTPEERRAIEAGEVEVGMRREAVLAAIGPPPAVGTMDLDGPAWKYWRNRWSTFVIRFDDRGRVKEIAR